MQAPPSNNFTLFGMCWERDKLDWKYMPLSLINRFCISLAATRSPSKNVLKVLADSESIGEGSQNLGD